MYLNKNLLYDEKPLELYDFLCCSDSCLKSWFFHSSPNGELSYKGEQKNIYCSLLDCCPGNLELKFEKNCCKEDKICLFICISFYFI
jgi:hypothetical protein